VLPGRAARGRDRLAQRPECGVAPRCGFRAGPGGDETAPADRSSVRTKEE